MSIRLTINEPYRQALETAGLGSFDALMGADVGEIVTTRKGRETRRVLLGAGSKARTIYIKRIFSTGPKHAFWPRLVGRVAHTPAVHEYNAIQTLTTAGVPTVRAVACGELRRFGFSRCGCIVTEAAPLRWTLNDWLTEGYARPRELSGDERMALMRGLGSLIWALSELGTVWPDLKAKHVFAEPDASGAWQYCLIDLERMRFRRGAATRGDLVWQMLKEWPMASLNPTTLRADEFREFLDAAYLQQEKEQGWVETEKGSRHYSRLWALFIGGDWLANLPDGFRHPNTLPMEKCRGMYIDARYMSALRAAGLDGYDRVMAFDGGTKLGKPGLASYRERVRITLNIDGASQVVYLKRYRRPPLREQLRRMVTFRLRRGSAEREMHYIRHLGILGIPTMTRIAYGSRMRGWFERDGFAMTAQVPGASLETLAEAWNSDRPTDCCGGLPSPATRRAIIEQLARIAGRMHGHDLFHRDLYLCHVFLSERADGRVVLSLIDLGRMIRAPRRRKRWIIKDLAALDYSSPRPLVTRADRLRFLYHYLEPWKDCPEAIFRREVRRIAASVVNRTQRMARHDAARKRRWGRG